MVFIVNKKDLGRISIKTKQTIVFPIPSTVTNITKVIASCGCTDVIVDKPNLKIIASYAPQGIPTHLEIDGHKEYKTTKTLTVTFEDSCCPGQQMEEILSFSAIVYKK